jgi:hypothetical protein
MNDNELRENISAVCEGMCAGYLGENGIDSIMQLITAERAKWEVEARIDELIRIRNIEGSTVDAWASPAYSHILDSIDDLTTELNNLKEKL